ncbi:MAG: hypothetical protein WA416_07225, partial [Candidatus Sulfotelmatobacter sp.]
MPVYAFRFVVKRKGLLPDLLEEGQVVVSGFDVLVPKGAKSPGVGEHLLEGELVVGLICDFSVVEAPLEPVGQDPILLLERTPVIEYLPLSHAGLLESFNLDGNDNLGVHENNGVGLPVLPAFLKKVLGASFVIRS